MHLTVPEAARMYGVSATCIYRRYERGLRGASLVSKHNLRHGPAEYDLDISEAQWREIAAFAHEVGLRKAYTTLAWSGIPWGAIAAAMRGEWWRLG